MLYFITMDDNKWTIELFLDNVRNNLNFPVQIISYEEARAVDDFRGAIVIFCDIERFAGNAINDAQALYDRAAAQGARRLLNNPAKVLRRFELLKEMRRQNINTFDVYRELKNANEYRYPVFIRNELDHYGPVSDLLKSQEELEKTLSTSKSKSVGPFSPIIVEYCDVNVDGYGFHKYGAFCLWEMIVPRHLFFSPQWMVKGTRGQLPEHIEMEKQYLAQNTFQEKVSEVFKIANIQYGRIDFAKTKEGLAIFEINTNPTVVDTGDLESNRRYATDAFISKFTLAMQHLFNTADN
jgi:hypothetical protein